MLRRGVHALRATGIEHATSARVVADTSSSSMDLQRTTPNKCGRKSIPGRLVGSTRSGSASSSRSSAPSQLKEDEPLHATWQIQGPRSMACCSRWSTTSKRSRKPDSSTRWQFRSLALQAPPLGCRTAVPQLLDRGLHRDLWKCRGIRVLRQPRYVDRRMGQFRGALRWVSQAKCVSSIHHLDEILLWIGQQAGLYDVIERQCGDSRYAQKKRELLLHATPPSADLLFE